MRLQKKSFSFYHNSSFSKYLLNHYSSLDTLAKISNMVYNFNTHIVFGIFIRWITQNGTWLKKYWRICSWSTWTLILWECSCFFIIAKVSVWTCEEWFCGLWWIIHIFICICHLLLFRGIIRKEEGKWRNISLVKYPPPQETQKEKPKDDIGSWFGVLIVWCRCF